MKTLDQTGQIQGPDKALLAELKNTIQQSLPAAEVLLYGSVARGTQHAQSDYDILVLLEQSIGWEQQNAIRDAIYDLELARQAFVSLVFCTRDQWNKPAVRVSPFRKEVERDAVAL